MRDPNRIPQIIARLQKVWERQPDLRLAQLIFAGNELRDPFYIEDEELMSQLEEGILSPQYSIGEVVFAQSSTTNSAGFRGTNHIGDERVRLLQLVRNGNPLPDGLFLIARHGTGGWRRITPEEIDWETSGICKTMNSGT